MLGNNDPILKVMEFLKPEEFYYNAMYLLFSSDRSHEKEYETQLKEAFKIANLSPKRYKIENNIIVLECSGYGLVRLENKISEWQNPSFTQVLAPATYKIAAGEAPPRLSSSSLENKVYTFR
jgi:hypothetical protein